MIKIESLKDYVGILTDEEIEKLANKIIEIVDCIKDDYPNQKIWYFEKQLPDTISTNTRNILFVRNPNNNEEIIAMSCLKATLDEKKICSLYVSYNYRNNKIGEKLVEESLKWLKTTKPLVTFPEYKLEMFKPIIDKYKWELKEIAAGLYNKKSNELCFNGKLSNNDEETVENNLYKRFLRALKKRCNQIK